MIPILFVFQDFALLILRLAIGLIFIAHGWPKIKDLRATAKNFEMMGFKPGIFWGPIVAVVEFFGGLLVITGLFTQLAGLLLAINMLVAMIWKMIKDQPLVDGYELDLILFGSSLIAASLGSGLYSAESFFQIWLF